MSRSTALAVIPNARVARRNPVGAAGQHTTEERERVFSQFIEFLYEGLTRADACTACGISNKTLAEWVNRYEELSERYMRARAEQAHIRADEALRIADEPCYSMEDAQRNRLRVDTRKWLASKFLPRVYGDKVLAEHTHKVGVVMLPSLPNGAADP